MSTEAMGGASPQSGNNAGTQSSVPTQTNVGAPESSQQMGGSSPQTKGSSQQTHSSTPSETFEVKVNNKIVKMTRDELIAHAQMSHAAQAKFEEAAKLRRDNEKFEQSLKKSKIQALIDKGFSPEEIREEFEQWYTQQFIEPETLSPEQKRARDMERELERYRNQEKERTEREQREQQEKMTAQQREYLQGQIIEALEKNGLPKNKWFAQRLAFYMRENLRNGWEAPMELIVSQVKKDHKEINSGISEDSTVEQLLEHFGEGIINKIRKHDLEQLRSKRKFSNARTDQVDGYGNGEKGEKIYSSDVNKRLREMRQGK
jgi:hypothetical protein